MLHGHGDNGYRYDQPIIADFSTNVWYGGEPAGLKEHLFGQWKRINKYPEVSGESLAQRLCAVHGLSPDNILVTNGATEGIYLLAQLFRNKSSCIVIPSFAEYEDACRMHEHRLHFFPWEELTAMTRITADLFWIGNPNNPTGAVFPALETILVNNPQTIFAVDEAFIEFTEAIPSAIGKVNSYPNLVVFRSMTKAFAIPGLRLGYVAAHRSLIEKLQELKIPWSVNTLALAAGDFMLDHYPDPPLPLTRLLQDRQAFTQQLQDLPIEVSPGHTHFFLCRTGRGSAADLQRRLLDTAGLLIRDAGNFRGLDPGHFRLATLAPEQNHLMVTALKKWEGRR